MMDRRFDMTNFEQSLKDHADHFTIVPSRKVWYGLYNDLHPGSRWPSIAMGLVFLFSLLGIGHLNNNSQQIASADATSINENAIPLYDLNSSGYISENSDLATNIGNDETVESGAKVIDLFTGNKINEDNGTANVNPPVIAQAEENIKEPVSLSAETKAVPGVSQLNNNSRPTVSLSSEKSDVDVTGQNVNSIHSPNRDEDLKKGITNSINNIKVTTIEEPVSVSNDKLNLTLMSGVEANPEAVSPSANSSSAIQPKSETLIDATVKPVLEKKKKNPNVNWVFYASPKITSVYFTGKPLQGARNTSFLLIGNTQPQVNMIYSARLGLETGTEMQLKFAKKWELITGAQVSYTGYNIVSHRVHPALATLVLKDADGHNYTKNYITYYGNGHNENQIVLPNYNVQISLPVGLQYEVWGNKKVQVKIASGVQPSLVLNSHSYLLSTDGRNYVEDPDLLRNVNLNTSFSSSVSFRSNNLKWHIGPTVRYQVLSTFKDIYPVKEHLIDYGIRIGISK